MKRAIVFMVTCVLVTTYLVLAGCGEKNATTKTEKNENSKIEEKSLGSDQAGAIQVVKSFAQAISKDQIQQAYAYCAYSPGGTHVEYTGPPLPGQEGAAGNPMHSQDCVMELGMDTGYTIKINSVKEDPKQVTFNGKKYMFCVVSAVVPEADFPKCTIRLVKEDDRPWLIYSVH